MLFTLRVTNITNWMKSKIPFDLSNEVTKESHFRDSYPDFWVKMLKDSKYKSHATIAVKN